jgi:hypothetical protein
MCIYNACPSRKFVVLKTLLSVAFCNVGCCDNFTLKEMRSEYLELHYLGYIQVSVTWHSVQLLE